MPTTIRAMRLALRKEDTPVMLTPAERIITAQSFPTEAAGKRELLLYSRLRELIKFTKAEVEKLPRTIGELSDFNHMEIEISFSVEQLELLETHFETLEKAGKLPNQTAIVTAWEKFENALDDEEPEAASPNGQEVMDAQLPPKLENA